jgi:DNA-binding PadR family transcriptional regulator
LDPIDTELVKGSTVTVILTVLDRGERYGYELIKQIELESGGKLQPKEGTIYPVLHQLEKEGAISSRWGSGDGARKRKYYRITARGRKILDRKKHEWFSFRDLMDRIVT